jgi:hypothetical protein
MVHFQDSILKCLHHQTLFSMLSNRIFEAHCAWILSCFGPRVGIWFIAQPIFPTSQFFSPFFSTTLQMWFGLPHLSIISLPMCVHTSHWPYGYPLLTSNVSRTTSWGPVCSLPWVDERNYMGFFQPHSILPIDELTLWSISWNLHFSWHCHS